MRTTVEIQDRITELDIRINEKQELIADDKKTWNCLNHAKLQADIDLMNREVVSLEWVLGKR